MRIKLMSALAIIVCVLMIATAFYGCGDKDTATADTASKISTPDTPDTVQTTAAVTTVESTTKSHDEYGIDYPEYAVDLAKMSLSEVIELMGGDFEVKFASPEDNIIYAPNCRVYICNETNIPGEWFFFEEASDKLVGGEYGSNQDEALLKIKDDILDGVYTDFDYINVREFGSVERSVYGGMKYNDFMKFAKNPNPVTVGGVGGIGQYVYDYTDGIDFVLAFYDGYGIEPDSDGTVSASVMESENPPVTQFIVKAKK